MSSETLKNETPRPEIDKTDIHHVLVTGGAGFIGSYTVDRLVAEGYDVTVMDSYADKVHHGKRPDFLNPQASYLDGDVRNIDDWHNAIGGRNIDAIIHLASLVGVGDSQARPDDYADVNVLGTSRLLRYMADTDAAQWLKKLVVASSMSIYGEGTYIDPDDQTGARLRPGHRPKSQLVERQWDYVNAQGNTLTPVGINETDVLTPSSNYALDKFDQEIRVKIMCDHLGIPYTAYRYWNAFGPRQSLNDPYTGVGANFAARVLFNKPPRLFEDGKQLRDFVPVELVAAANVYAIQSSKTDNGVYNVGSGHTMTVEQLAQQVLKTMDRQELGVEITGLARSGDIRHCVGDLTALGKTGFDPGVSFEEQFDTFIGWVTEQEGIQDTSDESFRRLRQRGVVF